MKRTAVVCALSLLIGGVALIPNTVESAGWVSRADSYTAPWMKDIERELLKKEYWMIYANDPRTPQNEVLHLLNRAAKAQDANDLSLAREPNQITLDVKDKMLTVRGERSCEDTGHYHVREIPDGSFFRMFTLPASLDHEKARAVHANGLLQISFPKREEAKARRILIEAA